MRSFLFLSQLSFLITNLKLARARLLVATIATKRQSSSDFTSPFVAPDKPNTKPLWR